MLKGQHVLPELIFSGFIDFQFSSHCRSNSSSYSRNTDSSWSSSWFFKARLQTVLFANHPYYITHITHTLHARQQQCFLDLFLGTLSRNCIIISRTLAKIRFYFYHIVKTRTRTRTDLGSDECVCEGGCVCVCVRQ